MRTNDFADDHELTLQEASRHFDVPRKALWRAVMDAEPRVVRILPTGQATYRFGELRDLAAQVGGDGQ